MYTLTQVKLAKVWLHTINNRWMANILKLMVKFCLLVKFFGSQPDSQMNKRGVTPGMHWRPAITLDTTQLAPLLWLSYEASWLPRYAVAKIREGSRTRQGLFSSARNKIKEEGYPFALTKSPLFTAGAIGTAIYFTHKQEKSAPTMSSCLLEETAYLSQLHCHVVSPPSHLLQRITK